MKTLTAMLRSKTDYDFSIYHKERVDESGPGVEVITSERNVGMTARIRLRQQSLKHIDGRRRERVRRRCHVQSPYPERVIPDERLRVAALLLKRPHPMTKRHCIVLAQTLDVA